MDMADMDKSKNIPDMLCFKTLWALCCFEWAGYYTLMMLFYLLKILLEYISDRLVSRRNLSLDFGTFLTHHWKLEDPRTHNVSRSPNNQTADQGIPQGLLGRWAGGYIGLLGSHEYIVNINRRCYGCKRLFWRVLYNVHFCQIISPMWKNVNDLFVQNSFKRKSQSIQRNYSVMAFVIKPQVMYIMTRVNVPYIYF